MSLLLLRRLLVLVIITLIALNVVAAQQSASASPAVSASSPPRCSSHVCEVKQLEPVVLRPESYKLVCANRACTDRQCCVKATTVVSDNQFQACNKPAFNCFAINDGFIVPIAACALVTCTAKDCCEQAWARARDAYIASDPNPVVPTSIPEEEDPLKTASDNADKAFKMMGIGLGVAGVFILIGGVFILRHRAQMVEKYKDTKIVTVNGQQMVVVGGGGGSGTTAQVK
jgi:hypothetical protein